MPTAATVRVQVESALARRAPSALTPAPRTIHPVTSTGIPEVDTLLGGGIPIGAITEMAGPECSGRTSLALGTLARVTREGKVAAWIDVCDALHPESAAAAGIDLSRLLWIRCGASANRQAHANQAAFALSESYFTAPPVKKGLHGGGFGPHPRSEERGLSTAVSGLLASAGTAAMHPRCVDSQLAPQPTLEPLTQAIAPPPRVSTSGPLARIGQALRVTDLLLQAGGFSAIVIDLAGIAPEHVTRIPAATWFRYRAAADKSRAAILLLTQHACAQSSAALVLRLQPAEPALDEPTLFSGLHNVMEVARQRFAPPPGSSTPLRKPPQGERSVEINASRIEINSSGVDTNSRRAGWHTQPTWVVRAGLR